LPNKQADDGKVALSRNNIFTALSSHADTNYFIFVQINLG